MIIVLTFDVCCEKANCFGKLIPRDRVTKRMLVQKDRISAQSVLLFRQSRVSQRCCRKDEYRCIMSLEPLVMAPSKGLIHRRKVDRFHRKADSQEASTRCNASHPIEHECHESVNNKNHRWSRSLMQVIAEKVRGRHPWSVVRDKTIGIMMHFFLRTAMKNPVINSARKMVFSLTNKR